MVDSFLDRNTLADQVGKGGAKPIYAQFNYFFESEIQL